MVKKQGLRELALNASQSFRTKRVFVQEWDIDVLIREPSSQAWLEWQFHLNRKEDEEITDVEKARNSMIADVILFTDILLDENKQPIFTANDREEVIKIYGPTHGRLLRQAIDMIMSTQDAEKKPETP